MDYTELNDMEFLALVDAGSIERFGHREHLRLAFLAAHRCDTLDDVIERCRIGIQRVAIARGAPDRYDARITAAWAEVMLEIVSSLPDASFDEVLAARRELGQPLRRP
jgi:hypothetical protein